MPFCSKFVWRKFCVEKKWQIWGLFISNKFNQFFPPTHRSFSSPVFLHSVFFSNLCFFSSSVFFQSVFFCNVACSTFQLPCCGQLDKKGEARFVQGICSRSTLTSVFYLAHLYHPRHLSQHHHCDNVFLCFCALSCRSSKNMIARSQCVQSAFMQKILCRMQYSVNWTDGWS